MDPLTNESKEPAWYRQFWPWFLIALPAAVVIACLFTIKLAIQSGDAVVRDDYYKEGLAINESIARDQRAAELGIGGVLELGAGGVVLELRGSSADAILADFRHPFDASLDMSLVLERIGSETFYQSTELVPAQRWYVELSPVEGAKDISTGEVVHGNWRVQAEQDFRNSAFLAFGEG